MGASHNSYNVSTGAGSATGASEGLRIRVHTWKKLSNGLYDYSTRDASDDKFQFMAVINESIDLERSAELDVALQK